MSLLHSAIARIVESRLMGGGSLAGRVTGGAKRRSVRSRRGQRGATFVEALIIAGVFIVVNCALLWLMGVYQTKLYTMRRVRQEVWNTASGGCQTPGVGGADTSVTGAPPDVVIMQLQGVLSQPQQLATTPIVKRTLTELQRQQTAATTRKQSTSTMNFAAKTFSTSNTVFCNEIPRDIQETETHMTATNFYQRFIGQ